MKLDFREFDKAYNEDVDKRIKEKNLKKARKSQNSLARQNYIYALVFLLAFVVGIKIVSGYVELNNYKYENAKIGKQIEQLKDDISNLRLQLDQKHDSATIEKIAREKLGMVYPDISQKRVMSGVVQYTLNPDIKNVIVRTDQRQQTANTQP